MNDAPGSARTAAFLRLPPFPGHRAPPLASTGTATRRCDMGALAQALARERVGGTFWAARPPLQPGRDVVLAPSSQAGAGRLVADAMDRGLGGRAVLAGPYRAGQPLPVIAGPCDPWHIVRGAALVLADGRNDLALVAALSGARLEIDGEPAEDGASMLAGALRGLVFHCPFTPREIAPDEAVDLLADWRGLIDANRPVGAVLGVAGWKRPTLDPLLWDGTGPVPHVSAQSAAGLGGDGAVLAWHARTPAALLDRLAARGLRAGEIEDGFIRSSGLGANCVPPLSVVVDPAGAHFDPARPSALERLLQEADLAPAMLARAARLRERLVAAGIGKYGQGATVPAPVGNGRRRVLVTGQVEDDRAMLTGGAGCTNRDLLARARALEPDAWLIYKPHPDVEAGHRKGHVPADDLLRHADAVERDAPIAALLDSVEAVHCITSLAGFEALLRGKAVTTHGVPFYAGWGLTRDLGPVPSRRTRRRTLDELVAAALLLYPRYLDPVTGLPCPAEVLVERIAAGQAQVASPRIWLRAWQGRLKRGLAGLGLPAR